MNIWNIVDFQNKLKNNTYKYIYIYRMLVKYDQRLTSWHHISFKGHVTMTFETYMSCDPDLLVFWCMAHTPNVFGV